MFLPLFLTDPREPALARAGEPVTVGVPLPRGLARRTDGWRLESADGTRVPVQARALDRWSDGTIRWALLDFQASANGRLQSL